MIGDLGILLLLVQTPSTAQRAGLDEAASVALLVGKLDATGVISCSASIDSTKSPGRVDSSGSIKPPQKIRNVNPEYPPSLLKKRAQGVVVLEAVITATGCINAVRILDSPDPLFSVSSVAAVSRWRFTPTIVKGVAVPVIMTVTTSFSFK